MSGWYASYWNAFLFHKRVSRILSIEGGHVWQGGHAWQWACVAGRRAYQEKWQVQWAVRILLECILVNIAVNNIGGFQIC